MYKIKLVQENPKVGDIQGNLDLAKSHITEAKEKDLDLIIFSEMFLTGYPPEDLLLREDFLEESERCSKELEGLSKEISIIIGCPSREGENIFLISKQGKIFCINSNEIYCSNEYSLGYLNEKTQLKNDYFLKIMASNHYLDIETNKNKSARLNLNKLNFKSNKSNFLIDFLKLDNDEYLENCFRLENFLD